MNRKQNVLVTGGLGQVGRFVTRRLSESGFSPVIFDNLADGGQDALIHGERLVVGELADLVLVDHALSHYKIDAVMHLAGFTSGDDSLGRPLACYRQNLQNTLTLLQLCVAHDVRSFVYASSAACSEPQLSPFASSKRMGEQVLSDCAHAYGMRYVALRNFSIAGAKPEGLIDAACAAATHERDGLAIYGDDFPTEDGTAIRDYLRVEDVASAYVLALEHLARGGSSLVADCGSGVGTSVADVIAAVKAQSRRSFSVARGGRRTGDPAAQIADASLIRECFGWRPRFDGLDEVIAATLAQREAVRRLKRTAPRLAASVLVPRPLATPPQVVRRIAAVKGAYSP